MRSVTDDALQNWLRDALARHRVPGVSVAVLRNDELHVAAAGVANVNTGVELTPETIMHIGSITKVFTTTLVMQLVDEAAVALDEPVLRYLPQLKLGDQSALERITVGMLLNHTSGIDGEILPDYGHDEETIEKGIGRLAQLDQLHAAGEAFSYCNAATLIAGYLTQRLGQKSWYQLVRERIFRPLKMDHGATLPEEALLHRASVGHYLVPTSPGKVVRTSCAFLPLSFSPAGTSLMMSPSDLLAFTRAHMHGGVGADGSRLLSERSTQAMQAATVDTSDLGYTHSGAMGLGWFLPCHGMLHHMGGGPGIIAALYACPAREWAAAVLTNAEHGLGLINEFMEPLLREVSDSKPYGRIDDVLTTGSADVEYGKYVGAYEALMDRFEVAQGPQGLMLWCQAKFACYESMSMEPSVPARLIPIGADRFLLMSRDGAETGAPDAFYRVFAFGNPDEQGRMQYLGNRMRLYKRIV